jgi:hypothetical protein
MIKHLFLALFSLLMIGCAELQQVANAMILTDDQVAFGLKDALNQGIDKKVNALGATNGFFNNELVKIMLPEELQVVDNTLRKIGLAPLADEGLKLLNRAAEDAVNESIPIFVDAVKGMTFNDARGILMGNKDAATDFLRSKTANALTAKFEPIIQNSLGKVGAEKVWTDLITKYNSIPLVFNKVNPDLTNYVTNEALKGVFTVIEQEELEIRGKASNRSTDLLKRVFALQD